MPSEQLTSHLPHIVWIRYLGSKRFIARFRGPVDKATDDILKVRKDKTIADAYLLPEGRDVEKFHQQRLELDK